jgi:serine/threonine protein kinase
VQGTSSALQNFLSRPDPERRLGPFHLKQQLGRGGFAPVWLASEVYDGIEVRPAAVKIFAFDRGAEARYREHIVREARSLCQVEHPGIVRFYSLLIDDQSGLIGLAMEYLSGGSLADQLRSSGTLGVDVTIEVGLAVASALDAAHRAGVVHRDVKPGNVMVTERGYKLIDFGIATAEEVEARQAAAPVPKRVLVGDIPLEIAGTKLSMVVGAITMHQEGVPEAPEGLVASGTIGYIDPVCLAESAPATPSSDLYALGAVLFECLTGKLPSTSTTDRAGLRGEVLDGRAAPPPIARVAPGVPAELAALIDSLLARDREQRPASAREVARMIGAMRDARLGPGEARISAEASSPSASRPAPTERSPEAQPDVARAPEAPGEGSGGRRWSVVAAIALAAIAAIVVSLQRPTPATPTVATAAPIAPVEAPRAAPPVPAAPAPGVVVGHLRIDPATATVSVDGVTSEVGGDGALSLSGEPGTAFDIVVAVGARTVRERVVLLRDGRTEPPAIALAEPSGRKPARSARAEGSPVAPAPAPAATPRKTEITPKDDF